MRMPLEAAGGSRADACIVRHPSRSLSISSKSTPSAARAWSGSRTSTWTASAAAGARLDLHPKHHAKPRSTRRRYSEDWRLIQWRETEEKTPERALYSCKQSRTHTFAMLSAAIAHAHRRSLQSTVAGGGWPCSIAASYLASRSRPPRVFT